MVQALLGQMKAEDLSRFSVLFLALAACLPVSCSDADPPSTQGAGYTAPVTQDQADEGLSFDGDLLWETAALPAPRSMTIAGVVVPPMVVEGYLESPWTEFSGLGQEGRSLEDITADFYADGHERFGELVRGVLLLREAESQFPELEAEEVDSFREQMLRAAGEAVFDAIERRYGPKGVTAHVERRLRLTKLEFVFQEFAPEVTDEELYEIYDREVLANLPENKATIEGVDVSFAAMAPKLRAPLQQKKTRLEMERWIDEHIGGVEVVVELASGRVLKWTEETPEPAETGSSAAAESN